MEEWSNYDLNPIILKNLEHLKFYTPTEIQKKVLVYTNSKVDLIVQARTGEGKTLCYGIPILNYIYNFYERAPLKQKKISPVSLILVHTRELGIQVKNHISALLKDYSLENINDKELETEEEKKERFYFNINIANVMGGFAKPKQIKILEKYNPEIIIATPGRLWEIISNEETNFLNKLYRLRFFVIDEADRMTEKGHFRELKQITEFLYTKLESIDIRKAESKNNDNYSSDEEDQEKEEKIEEEIIEKVEKTKLKTKKQDKKTANEIKILGKYKEVFNKSKLNENEIDKLLETEKLEDLEENKKIARELKKKRNINFADIETIDPMMLFANMDEEMILDEDQFAEDLNNKKNKKNKFKNGNVEDLELNEDDYDYKKKGKKLKDENREEKTEENENEDRDKEKGRFTLDTNKMSKLKSSEANYTNFDKQSKIPKHFINMRTILCSATIETIIDKDNNKNKKFPNKKNKNKNINIGEEDQQKLNLDGLIKNLKFFNKCLYVKLNNFSKPTETTEADVESDYYDSYKKNQIYNNRKTSNLLPEKLELDCFKCSSQLKDYYLYHLLKEYENKTIMVFSNSISHTKKLFNVFSLFDFKLSVLHSKMQQTQRLKNLERFIKKENTVLFCTDVGARGLDIPSVDLVIHYHIPKTTENFIHRSGRTARALKEGKSISLISEMELNLYKKIMKDIKISEFGMKTLNLIHLERYKSLFEYAKKIERDDHKEKKVHREKQWYEKTASQCDLIFDEREENMEEESDDDNKEKNVMLNKKRKLDSSHKFQNKKLYQHITSSGIKRTSFLNPEMVQKLNSMLSGDKMSNLNLTQTIFEANKDAQSFRFKEKQKKKRYQRRRKK